jgi:hypothetical protein
MRKFALLIAAVASFAFAGSASAQDWRYGGGHPSHSPGYNYYVPGHYDYHPGQFVRHGDHFHYIPGHFDYHRGSHHHYNRGPDIYRGAYGNYDSYYDYGSLNRYGYR